MTEWPSTLPQAPYYSYSGAQVNGLLSEDEVVNPIRLLTYPDQEYPFIFHLTVEQMGYLRTFWDETTNQADCFTAPWLETIGYTYHVVQFTAPPVFTLRDTVWEASITLRVIPLVETDSSGTPVIWEDQ